MELLFQQKCIATFWHPHLPESYRSEPPVGCPNTTGKIWVTCSFCELINVHKNLERADFNSKERRGSKSRLSAKNSSHSLVDGKYGSSLAVPVESYSPTLWYLPSLSPSLSVPVSSSDSRPKEKYCRWWEDSETSNTNPFLPSQQSIQSNQPATGYQSGKLWHVQNAKENNGNNSRIYQTLLYEPFSKTILQNCFSHSLKVSSTSSELLPVSNNYGGRAHPISTLEALQCCAEY